MITVLLDPVRSLLQFSNLNPPLFLESKVLENRISRRLNAIPDGLFCSLQLNGIGSMGSMIATFVKVTEKNEDRCYY